MQLFVDGISDVGQERQQNEDRMQIAPLVDGSQLLVVCDGMGGHEAGNVASEVATRAIVEYISAQPSSAPPPQLIWDALHASNDAVRREAQARGIPSMGTTAVVGWLIGDQLWCGWVGDSRLYHFRDGVLQIQTEDHTRVQKMVEMQILSAEEAKHHPEAHVLTQALGGGMDAQASFHPSVWSEPSQIRDGDSVLLCSDGLYDLVDDAELYPLIGGMEVLAAVQRLIDTANGRGGHDNVTVIVASVGSPQLAKGPPPDMRKTMVVTPGAPGAGGVLAVPTEGASPGPPPPSTRGEHPKAARPPVGGDEPPSARRGSRTSGPPGPPPRRRSMGWIWAILGVAVGVGAGAAIVLMAVYRVEIKDWIVGDDDDSAAIVEEEGEGDPIEPPATSGNMAVVYADALAPTILDGIESGEVQVEVTLGDTALTVAATAVRPSIELHTVLAIDRAGHMESHWPEANRLATRFMDDLPESQAHEIELIYFTNELQTQLEGSRSPDVLRAKLAETAPTTNVWGHPAKSKLQDVIPQLVERAAGDEHPHGAQLLLFTTPSSPVAGSTLDRIVDAAIEQQVSIWPVVFRDERDAPRVMAQFQKLAERTRGRLLMAEDVAARFDDLGNQASVPERLIRIDVVAAGAPPAAWEIARNLKVDCTGPSSSTMARVVRVVVGGGAESARVGRRDDAPVLPVSTGAATGRRRAATSTGAGPRGSSTETERSDPPASTGTMGTEGVGEVEEVADIGGTEPSAELRPAGESSTTDAGEGGTPADEGGVEDSDEDEGDVPVPPPEVPAGETFESTTAKERAGRQRSRAGRRATN